MKKIFVAVMAITFVSMFTSCTGEKGIIAFGKEIKGTCPNTK